MKKLTKEITGKTIEALGKEEFLLRGEIAKMTVEAQANPQKDTNALVKKKKRLAVMLTIMRDLMSKELLKKAAK